MNYDPNLTNCGNRAIQTVELTFQTWEYTVSITTKVSGNCTGLDVIEAAVDNIKEDLEEVGEITLTDAQGNTKTCELWEFDIKEMLVSARITDIESQTV